MKNKKTLKEKIIQSVFVYETARLTFDAAIRMIMLILSAFIILVFGEIVIELITESNMAGLIKDFMDAKEYSFTMFGELGDIILKEIPAWLLGYYFAGLILGCILIASIIRNRKSLFHKARSLMNYWLKV